MTRYDTYIELVPASLQRDISHGVMRYGFSRHLGVSGFQKIISQWLKALMTLQGSDVTDRDYGTVLPNLIGSNITTESDIQSTIEMCVDKATQDILRYQADKNVSSATELLASATLTALFFRPEEGAVDVRIVIENQAGDSIRIQVPVLLGI